MSIPIKTPQEIEKMRRGGKILAEILRTLAQEAREGVSTLALDQKAREICLKYKVEPSFLGYHGFPAAICASINEEIVHGIPSERCLQKGDLLSIDCGVYHEGFHTDACITLAIGAVSPLAENLLNTAKKALSAAISVASEGVYLSELSRAIQRTVENNGFFVVRNLTGHGIGRELHEEPQILNYGTRDAGPLLQAGMTLAIEPIITINNTANHTAADHWTIIANDGSLSTHFEHTIVITKKGAEILTA